MRLNIVLLLFAASASATVATRINARQRPNVVMIAIDDLNDWIGPLGGHPQVQTPAIDSLARRGTTFTNAHCQSPLCNPSRTSLLTGRRPSTTGVYGLAPWFRDVDTLANLVTLPQAFQRSGYKTLIGGKIYHGNYGRNQAAEAEVWGPPSSVGAKPDQKLIPQTPMGNHPLMDWGVFPHRDEDKGDWIVASWAVEQLANLPQDSDQPFFLAAGFFLPHVPCYATQKWFDLYPVETTQLPPIIANDRDDVPFSSWYIHWELPEPRTRWLIENEQLLNLTRSYLASVSFVDSQVGRILQAIEDSGHADDTIVVLWSDHGYHMGEKGISGKNSLWQRSTRVPLIFAGPGINADAKSDAPVELLDVYPTLVEVAGLEAQVPGGQLEGLSLQPQLVDAGVVRKRPAITTHNPGNHAVCSRQYRLIRYVDGAEEFYDCLEDPSELVNRINDPKLADVIDQHRGFLPSADAPPAPGSQHRILIQQADGLYWEGKKIEQVRVPE